MHCLAIGVHLEQLIIEAQSKARWCRRLMGSTSQSLFLWSQRVCDWVTLFFFGRLWLLLAYNSLRPPSTHFDWRVSQWWGVGVVFWERKVHGSWASSSKQAFWEKGRTLWLPPVNFEGWLRIYPLPCRPKVCGLMWTLERDREREVSTLCNLSFYFVSNNIRKPGSLLEWQLCLRDTCHA